MVGHQSNSRRIDLLLSLYEIIYRRIEMDEEKKCECKFCGKEFNNLIGLATHYNKSQKHINFMLWDDYKDKFIYEIDKSNYIKCEICEKKLKNLRCLGNHYYNMENHKEIMTWVDYKDKFIYKIDKSNYIECKICNSLLKTNLSLACHIKKEHNLNSQQYYDQFDKRENEDICNHPECINNTTWISFNEGYLDHCSSICAQTNPVIAEKRLSSFYKTLDEHPEILENILEKYLLWVKENPKDSKERGQAGLRTRRNDIDPITGLDGYERGGKKGRETKRNNIDPVTGLDVYGKVGRQKKEWYKNMPKEIKKEISDKISITLRNKYNQLSDPNSTIPYFLYIIRHLENPIIKIGRSGSPEARIGDIISTIGKCEIIHILQGPYNKIQPLESLLHDHFNDYCKVQPKGISGRTEWFDGCILEEVIGIIKNV